MSAPNDLVIRFRGTRGSIPSPAAENMRYGGNTSCVEIRLGSELLILDAGSGLRRLGEDLLRAAGEAPIDASLLLSHAHWDHIQGLPFFMPGYRPQNSIRIFTAFGKSERLHRALTEQMSPLHFPVGLNQMVGLRSPQELQPAATHVGSFCVRTIGLNHPGGCTGFRIEANGRSIAYLPDHEPYGGELDDVSRRSYETLIKFAGEVDVLILDTQYTADEYRHRVGWGHGCLPESVRLAMRAGAKRLLLFHHDPSHADTQIDSMVEEARSLAFGKTMAIEAAAEDAVLNLSRDCSSTATPCAGMEMPVTPPGFVEATKR